MNCGGGKDTKMKSDKNYAGNAHLIDWGNKIAEGENLFITLALWMPIALKQ